MPPLGAAGGAPRPQSGPTPTLGPEGYVSHDGRWLLDSQGRILLLHGLNLSEKLPGQLETFRAADADYLADMGFSVVRLAFPFGLVMPTPGKIDRSYLQLLARKVDLLTSRHIYVLLDVHQDLYGPATWGDGFPSWATLTDGAANPNAGFPAGYTADPAVQTAFRNFWKDTRGPGGVGLQEQYVRGLVTLAERFRDNPMVLGFDVMNEPWPGARWASTCGGSNGCPDEELRFLQPFYTKAAAAIRAVDRRQMIFVEPFLTFDYAGVSSLPAFGAPMNGFSFHPYLNPQTPKAVALSQQNGDALLVTEFGATSDVSSIESSIAGLDSNQLPWIYWAYGGIPTTTADQQAMQAVAEPYPLAVAGVPTSYGFDPASGSFHLDYLASRTNGRPFPSGSETVVEIPPGTYAHGYNIESSGGRIVSKPCANQLAIKADAGSVSITVSPGGTCT